MTEDDVRRVELVRAFETEDREEVLLTREDREQADARGRQIALAGGTMDRKGEERFLAGRAEFAAERLATRHPGVARLLAQSRWPAWLSWAIPLAALAAGFLANELGTGKRLELLAVPLLGTLAWNLLVYLTLIAAPFTRGAKLGSRLLAWFSGLGEGRNAQGSAIERASASFRRRWLGVSAKLNGLRLSRTLHLSAALFVAGLIAGIYLRALVIEYRAGWESTFLGPEAVHRLLSFVLGPASVVTGTPIAPVETIAAMRWPASGIGGGVNAGPWLHLYTTTLAGLVIIPRLLLAAVSAVRAQRLAGHFPVSDRADFYVRRVLRSATGRSAAVRITPYGFRPDEAMRHRLGALLRGALGDGARVEFDPPVDYGSEDGWLKAATLSPDIDYHIMLFNLASTPEAENHGAFAAGLVQRLTREQPGAVPAVLIDDGAMRGRLGRGLDSEDRMRTRASAWRDALAASGLAPVVVDLVSATDDDALARRIESGLLRDGALRA